MNTKYYIDCEFLEGKQDKRFLGIKYGQTKPTIDLISIALVSEDREYYAISKDFNLKEAWDRYDLVDDYDVNGDLVKNIKKVYWIRENILKPMYSDYVDDLNGKILTLGLPIPLFDSTFNYKNFKRFLKIKGKSNNQIAEEIKEFVAPRNEVDKVVGLDSMSKEMDRARYLEVNPIEFWGYYSDYDHVCLCWLFGKMINLPKGFPMLTYDLKQELDRKANAMFPGYSLDKAIEIFKAHPNIVYPKQANSHNALDDARWNKELHKFINSL